MSSKFILSLVDRLKANPKKTVAIVLLILLISTFGVFSYRKNQTSQRVKQQCYLYMEGQDLPYFERREDVAQPKETKEGWVFQGRVSYIGNKGEIVQDYECLVQEGEVVQVEWLN